MVPVKRWFKPATALGNAGNSILCRALQGSPLYESSGRFFHKLKSAIQSGDGEPRALHAPALATQANIPGLPGTSDVLRACLKSRMRGHVIVGVMTISTDVDKLYDTDLTDAAWALIAPMLPAARPGGRPRKINIRAVLNAIFYLLRTGCQWRLLPREFPGWSTVYHYFRAWKNAGVWTCIQRSMYQQARRQAGRAACPSVVIMDGQSVKTTERGGIRGFDAHKRVKGRKRHILVDTLGLLIACRVEPADISDRKAAALLLGGLRPLFPNIRTVIADAGHQSRKLARHLLCQDGWKLQIVKRRQRAFKITGLTWIVERSFAWLGRNRRLNKDYEYCVQSSETLIEIAATRLMLNRLAQA